MTWKPNLRTFPAGDRGRCLPSRAEAGPTESREGIPEGLRERLFSNSSHNHRVEIRVGLPLLRRWEGLKGSRCLQWGLGPYPI